MWTEYCSDLTKYKTDGDPIVPDCPQILGEEFHHILQEEVESVKAQKMGTLAGVASIPAELVQAGGEAMIDIILTSICNTIWKTGEWPMTWTQSLVITLPTKGNLLLLCFLTVTCSRCPYLYFDSPIV